MVRQARPSILGGLACLSGALVVVLVIIFVGWDAWRVSSFATTVGRIRSKEVGSKISSNQRVYFPILAYVYKVGEIEHAGSSYTYYGSTGSESWATDIVDKTVVGANCTVFYNPKKPLESTLNPKPSTTIIFGCLFGFILAVGTAISGIQQLVIGMNAQDGRRVWN